MSIVILLYLFVGIQVHPVIPEYVLWTRGHSNCLMHIDLKNSSRAGSKSCHEATYMRKVHLSLKEPSSTPYERNIYSTIKNLYDDLAANVFPRTVVLDAGGTNERKIALHPISFSIPRDNLIATLPHKSQSFGQVIPGKMSTYFNLYNESQYFDDLRRSLFSLTYKKGGWDCLRHLEILAAGSLPLFVDIAQCPNQTLVHHPKALYRHILDMPGLVIRAGPREEGGSMALRFEQLEFDEGKLDRALYSTVAAALLQYTRNVLSTEAMAGYVLDTMHAFSRGRLSSAAPRLVLYLSHSDRDMDKGDYLTDMLLHGLKKTLGHDRVVDFPRRDGLYKGVELFRTPDYLERKQGLYGNGFSWGLTLDAFATSNERDTDVIARNIAERKYDLVILGSGHRDGWASKLYFWDLICKHYNPLEVGWVDGSDKHTPPQRLAKYASCAGHMFSREGFSS